MILITGAGGGVAGVVSGLLLRSLHGRQVAYHRWPSRDGMYAVGDHHSRVLPVPVLGMGTVRAHMLRADAEAPSAQHSRTGQPAILRSLSWSSENQAGPSL